MAVIKGSESIRLQIGIDISYIPGLSSLYNGGDINISGATRIYLIPSVSVTGYTQNSATSMITDIATNQQWSVLNNVKDLNFDTIVDESRNGVLYVTDIAFSIPSITTIKTKVVLGITGNEYTCIIQDNNDCFWLIGYDKTIISNGIKYGTTSNGYNVKLAVKELQPMLQVSPAYMQTIQLYGYADADYAAAVTSGTYISVPATAVAGALTGSSVIYPPTGYTITNDVTFVLCTSGSSIKLPAAPQANKVVTIKDVGAGSTHPVTILGNGKEIEGESYAEVNTDAGAMELIYINGSWRVKNFFNI